MIFRNGVGKQEQCNKHYIDRKFRKAVEVTKKLPPMKKAAFSSAASIMLSFAEKPRGAKEGARGTEAATAAGSGKNPAGTHK